MAKDITNPERHIIAVAFRRLARGVGPKTAYASTVGFYRASGQEWARRLG